VNRQELGSKQGSQGKGTFDTSPSAAAEGLLFKSKAICALINYCQLISSTENQLRSPQSTPRGRLHGISPFATGVAEKSQSCGDRNQDARKSLTTNPTRLKRAAVITGKN